jgi:AraC family transcriptional activator of pobA
MASNYGGDNKKPWVSPIDIAAVAAEELTGPFNGRTVQHIAETLNISPNYLSNMLKMLTGQSTQQHIHDKLIEKAREKLSTTELSVSEIAYELGFEHPQSFSKLFKTKTRLSLLEFRQSFN